MGNYKEVKNVIHNEIGVSKEEILQVFREITEKEIQKIMKDNTDFIKDCIRDVVQEAMFNAVDKHKYPKISGGIWNYGNGNGKVKFNDYISGVIKEEILNEVKKQFKVTVNIDKE